MLHNRLKDLREDSDLLQKDIAKILNCSQVCYSYYENEMRDIPTQVLVTLSAFYNVSIDYILCQTDRPERLK